MQRWKAVCVLKRAIGPFSPPGFGNTEKLEVKETRIVVLFINKNYNVFMAFRTNLNVLKPTVRFFSTGAGPNLVRMSFVPAKCRDYICPIHKMSLRSASISPVQVKLKSCILFSWVIFLAYQL